jgi:uncharacterized Zn finger protein (UPF0148 family)
MPKREFIIVGLLSMMLLLLLPAVAQEADPDPCHMCEQKIKGKFWEFPDAGNFYCDSCYVANPHCAQCGQPMMKSVKIGENEICPACAQSLPKCRGCGLIVVGAYYTLNEVEGVFCADCIENKSKCDICGLPTGGRFTELSDGRKSCSICQETAVTEEAEARSAFETVRDYLAGELSLSMERPVTMELTDLNEIDSLGRELERVEGTRMLGLFKRDGDSFAIYVVYGLPLALTIKILCHEFGHVWQSDNYPDVSQLIHKEGFAEWVSYKALIRLGNNREAEQMRRRPDIYGKGLNLFLQRESAAGVDGVMGLLRGDSAP